MYNVSAAFKTAMKKTQRIEHIKGTIGTVSFDDSNVISLNYSNRCSDTSDVTLGSAYIGQIQAQFCNVAIDRYAWMGKAITIQYGLEIDDEGTTEWIPVGVFYVTQAEWSVLGVSVTASDCLSLFDGAMNLDATNGTIYDLAKMASLKTGVKLGMTKAQADDLPNSDRVFALYPENDINTVRDFISWVGQLPGGFVTADRTGGFVIRSFDSSEVVDTLQARERIAGSVFSDYVTNYAGISVVDNNRGTELYTRQVGGGSIIALGNNPFMQYGTSAVKDAIRYAIADVVNTIAYVPCNISLLNCPVYDLGDLLKCVGGVAGTGEITVCVMSIEWTFKNTITLQGFGADPSLSAGKTKTDKALQGMMNKTSENEVVTHTYVNSMGYELANHKAQDIVDITFATKQPRKVLIFNEIMADIDVIDTENGAEVTLYYYLNDQLESYKPVGTFFKDGTQTLDRMYFLDNLSGGTAYEWRVEIKVDGGTATIARGDVHSVLQGQGLVAVDEFAGTIKCEDVFEPIPLDRPIVSLTDAVSLFIATIEVDIQITDYIDTDGMFVKSLVPIQSEACEVNRWWHQYAISSDDGNFVICDNTGTYVLVNTDGGYF